MKVIVKDDKNQAYEVTLTEDDYIESYKKINDSLVPKNKEPDYTDAYFQIDESLPSRFSVWKL